MKHSKSDTNPSANLSANPGRRRALHAAGAGIASVAMAAATSTVAGAAPAPRKSASNKTTLPRTPDGRWARLRRVVTSDNAAGKGVVLFDGEPTNSFEFNGTRITRLWEASGLPIPLPLGADAGATAGNAYRPGFAGTSFYVAELPGGARAPAIPMHKNTTVDYMAILSGRIVLRIEERDIELGPGDTIVQGANLHTFINRWEEPCLLLFVVVTGVSSAAKT